MFKPVLMKSVTLRLLRDEADQAALVLAETEAFQPDTPLDPTEVMPEAPGARYSALYRSARAHMDKLLDACGGDHATPAPTSPSVVSEVELADVDRWLREAWRECSEQQEVLRHIDDEQKRVRELLQTLETFEALAIDLADVARERRFLDVQIGTLPMANLGGTRNALRLAGYVARVFYSAPPLAHVIIAGPRGRESEVAALLRTAGWRALHIPAELSDYPERARTKLLERQREAAERAARQARAMEEARRDRSARVARSCELLAYAEPYAELARSLRARGNLASVTGWAPSRDAELLRERLAARLGDRFVMSERDPGPDERSNVPSLVAHRAWLEPFSVLVEKYGVPRYGEIDPTIPFAISFIAMFGMMFGDVGQGAVIAFVGAVFRRRLGRFTPFLVAAGLASMVFGVLYGSVFGLETILSPIWIAPLHDPIRMVLVALYWGIGFIVLTSGIAIYNFVAEHQIGAAAFGSRGLAGVASYLASAWVAHRYLTARHVGAIGLGAIAVPLAAVGVYEWRRQRGTTAERALVVAIESVETVLTYAANTLSFLRVAAFSLNHVALALAIFSIAKTMGPAGHWLTIVIGNVFVLVLEGAIVAIQALRLEYYEGFARFFRGDGRPFHALGIRLATAAR